MRLAFYISMPIAGFLALMFFATIGGQADITVIAASVMMFVAFLAALHNLVEERKVGATPLAKLYFAAWIYSIVLFAGTQLAYFLGLYHPG
jgi:hypothetical protein